MRYTVTIGAEVRVKADNPYAAARKAIEQFTGGSIVVTLDSPEDPGHWWRVEMDPWTGPEGVVSHVGVVSEYDRDEQVEF